jgi:transcriptional regulator with XRE-family HTH domain
MPGTAISRNELRLLLRFAVQSGRAQKRRSPRQPPRDLHRAQKGSHAASCFSRAHQVTRLTHSEARPSRSGRQVARDCPRPPSGPARLACRVQLRVRNPRKSNGTKAAGATARRVGARIKFARQAAGLSQATLAEAAGVSRQQLLKYERGADRVSADRLQRIAEKFQKPIAFFFSETEDGYSPDLETTAQRVFDWAIVSPPRRLLLATLPVLSDADAESVLDLARRLSSGR